MPKTKVQTAVDKLLELGYKYSSHLLKDTGEHTFSLIKGTKTLLRISISSSELPYCCGVHEFGSLKVVGNSVIRHDTKLLLTEAMLIEIANNYEIKADDSDIEEDSTIGVIMCSNGEGSWSTLMEPTLKKLQSKYEIILETINPNTGNNITMYTRRN